MVWGPHHGFHGPRGLPFSALPSRAKQAKGLICQNHVERSNIYRNRPFRLRIFTKSSLGRSTSVERLRVGAVDSNII